MYIIAKTFANHKARPTARLGSLYFFITVFARAAVCAQPVSVTNLAGRAISGELVSVTAKDVQLRTASGADMKIPLSALPQSEGARLKKLAGIPEPVSPAVAMIQRDLANTLARIDAREKAGSLSPEDAAKRRAEARAWAEKSLGASGQEGLGESDESAMVGTALRCTQCTNAVRAPHSGASEQGSD